jgi:hypothetical protein
MVWLFKKETHTEVPNQKILDLKDEITDLKIAIKEIKNDLIKLDIRVLENQKNYQTKLLRLIKNEEKEEKVEPKEEKKDINSSVFLLE